MLCVDEKSQIQALNRTQKVLPMQPGHAEQRTHDYVRHGTTTLFAALEIATGKVTGLCKNRHRHQEFLAFLKHLARAYPDRELHLVMDNYATHKTSLGAKCQDVTQMSSCSADDRRSDLPVWRRPRWGEGQAQASVDPSSGRHRSAAVGNRSRMHDQDQIPEARNLDGSN